MFKSKGKSIFYHNFIFREYFLNICEKNMMHRDIMLRIQFPLPLIKMI